jgi:hypothetical protein
LIISDACRGLVEAAAEVFPDTDWQRCVVHFYRNVFSHVPNGKVADVARMLKAIHAQEDRKAAAAKAKEVVARLRTMKLKTAADLVRAEGCRDADLLRLSRHALATDSHEQSARADHPRDPPAHAGGRCVPGRELGADAGRGATAAHCEYEMGQAALPPHGEAAQPREARSGGSGLRTDRATAKEKCERSVALPIGLELLERDVDNLLAEGHLIELVEDRLVEAAAAIGVLVVYSLAKTTLAYVSTKVCW